MSDEEQRDDDILMHYGILRKSGRYPWGSGKDPYQRAKSFQSMVSELEKKGLKPKEIMEALGLNTTEDYRTLKALSKNQIRAGKVAEAQKLRAKGMSPTAIGERMGIRESSVRSLLDASLDDKNNILNATMDFFKEQIADGSYLDVGKGVENHRGISETKKKVAIAALVNDEGYEKFWVRVPQLGTNNETTVMVLAPPGTKFSDVVNNIDKIKDISGYSEDGGRSFKLIEKPTDVDSKRIGVRYAEEGGADKDGVIELRRGVEDLSLGDARYAQVRISVDGTHYLKGMAMYSDDMPDGVDILFNTNKSDTGNKLDAMKSAKLEKENLGDENNPFGGIVRQKTYIDSKGNEKLSPLNIVGGDRGDGKALAGEEGYWATWSKTLSSQMLSKQDPELIKQQLDLSYAIRKEELDTINSLTNPAVKKTLLQGFADSADAAAEHLKAAGLPRTANHVILPINSMKDNEVYAPNYKDGEKVVLIRHPHGGIFEIPELTVNNKNREANRLIKNAKDAVGINSKVASQLSGADFDGDTVLVIPNNNRSVKTAPPLEGLKNFDPKAEYPKYEGMEVMRNTQRQMGDISNLITDMTIKGANMNEIARAVRHSMVVIDAEKHELNYKQSAIDNGIRELKKRYQGRTDGGASTLISKSKSVTRVPERKPRPAAEGGSIDPATGKKVYVETGKTYTNKQGKTVQSMVKSTKMAEAEDARSLSSGTQREGLYADYANRMKALANSARKEYVATKPFKYSPEAKERYAEEVASLKAKLNIAQKNAPLERKAQLVANATLKLTLQSNPGLDKDGVKKAKDIALRKARANVGASKKRVEFTPKEWEAVQAGAISNSFLESLLKNADLDVVKQLATPRDKPAMSNSAVARAKAMLARGYTQAEVASALGVSTSTLANYIK